MGTAKRDTQKKKKGGPGHNAMLFAIKGKTKYTKQQTASPGKDKQTKSAGKRPKQIAARQLSKVPNPATAAATADAAANARLAKRLHDEDDKSSKRKPNGNADPQWQKIQRCTAKARKFEGESGPKGNLISKSWWYLQMKLYLDPGITISNTPEEEYGGETARDVGREWCAGIAQILFSKGIQNLMTQHGNMYDLHGKHTTRVTRTVQSFDCYGPGALDDFGGGNHQDAPVVRQISRQLAYDNHMTFDMQTQ